MSKQGRWVVTSGVGSNAYATPPRLADANDGRFQVVFTIANPPDDGITLRAVGASSTPPWSTTTGFRVARYGRAAPPVVVAAAHHLYLGFDNPQNKVIKSYQIDVIQIS